jgi:hypothetical protein
MAVKKITAQNYEIFSGDTAVFNVVVYDENGAVKDITGATARFVMVRKIGQTPVVDLTTAAGIVLTDPTNGALRITVQAGITAALSGSYRHELEVTDVAGRVSTVAFGTVAVKRDAAF